jgi:hypothetical protein
MYFIRIQRVSFTYGNELRHLTYLYYNNLPCNSSRDGQNKPTGCHKTNTHMNEKYIKNKVDRKTEQENYKFFTVFVFTNFKWFKRFCSRQKSCTPPRMCVFVCVHELLSHFPASSICPYRCTESSESSCINAKILSIHAPPAGKRFGCLVWFCD